MSPRRILLVFGTRPEAIKMIPVVHALRAMAGLETRICVTAQHRALLDQILALGHVIPDIDLDLMTADQGLDALGARLLSGLGNVYQRLQPHLIVVQGDTISALFGALAAHHRRLPVAHVEAGLRSGDLANPWPEEGNRRMISALATLHFAPTARAAAALAGERIDPKTIHVTGNPVIDALHATRAQIAADPMLAAGLDPFFARFAGRRLILVTTHRRETLGAGLARIAQALARIADRSDVAIVLPLHPNPVIRRTIAPILGDRANVALLDPLDYPQFVHLLDRASLVLTDSGGVQEEAPALGKPVLVLRDTTERPEGPAAGTARLVGTDPARIVQTTLHLLDDADAYAAMARAHNPYGDGRSAPRIAQIIADYLADAQARADQDQSRA
jgi:UDP-N-acetylglucosamine 2-epimerase (non-hydrolysing)